MIRAITVDAAGTLFVPRVSVGSTYALIAARHGVQVDGATLDERFPSAFSHVRSLWRVPYGADENDARNFWNSVIDLVFEAPMSEALHRQLFDAFAEATCWQVCPGVGRALAWAAGRGLPVAVVSNFDGRLPGILGGLGLGPFAAVITSAAEGVAKPDAALLHRAAARLGVQPAEILHIGDSPGEDLALAEAAGAQFLLVRPGAGIALDALQKACA